MPFLTAENKDKYMEAYEISQFEMLNIYAAFQKHIDQGISMTLYITSEWNTFELARVYAYAHHLGIKSVYYVRQRIIKIEDKLQTDGFIEFEEKGIAECEACAI